MTGGTCTCAHACTVCAHAEREWATLHTCICMAHVHGAHACACWWTQRACAGGVCEGWLPPRLVLRLLHLGGNAISVLPAGIFDQLTSLRWVGERGWEDVWGHGRGGGSVWEHVWLGMIGRRCMRPPCLYVSMCERDWYGHGHGYAYLYLVCAHTCDLERERSEGRRGLCVCV